MYKGNVDHFLCVCCLFKAVVNWTVELYLQDCAVGCSLKQKSNCEQALLKREMEVNATRWLTATRRLLLLGGYCFQTSNLSTIGSCRSFGRARF
jgi:hypothetical protein